MEHAARLPSAVQQQFGEFAPKLAEFTDKVLFEDLWERPQLSKRDRSLIACAALVACEKTEQMASRFSRFIDNGFTQDELVELTTHLAFYTGWSSAVSAMTRVQDQPFQGVEQQRLGKAA